MVRERRRVRGSNAAPASFTAMFQSVPSSILEVRYTLICRKLAGRPVWDNADKVNVEGYEERQERKRQR